MPKASQIRVLLADDQKLVRAGWCVLLDASAAFTVVGQAKDGQEAVELAQQLCPDIILMDLKMPRLDGLEATWQIVSQKPTAKILVITQSLDEVLIRTAMQNGASGYLGKSDAFDELLTAIRAVRANQFYFGKTIREQWPHLVGGPLPRVGGGGAPGASDESPGHAWRYWWTDFEKRRVRARAARDEARVVRQRSQVLRSHARQTRAFSQGLRRLRHPVIAPTV